MEDYPPRQLRPTVPEFRYRACPESTSLLGSLVRSYWMEEWGAFRHCQPRLELVRASAEFRGREEEAVLVFGPQEKQEGGRSHLAHHQRTLTGVSKP